MRQYYGLQKMINIQLVNKGSIKYPGKRYYSGNKKGKPSGNPLGKNPSDFMEVFKQIGII